MIRDSAEYGSVRTSGKEQCPTHLEGAKPETDAKPNDSTGFRDCDCSAARAYPNMRRALLGETDNTAERNANRSQN